MTARAITHALQRAYLRRVEADDFDTNILLE
jgi:hypothetical protein